MLMIVFGAGASYDSVPRRDWNSAQENSLLRPPLAVELFSKRSPFDSVLTQYPWCVPLVTELRGAVARQEPIEEALQRFAILAEEGDELLRRQLMALRFYLKNIIKECGGEWLQLAARGTNYATLVNVVERLRSPTHEDVLIVTFNYDRMLEDALELTVGQTFVKADDYVFGDDRHYRVVKPHGSVDWKRLVRLADGTPEKELIQEAAVLTMTEDVYMSGEESDKAGIPALAVPTRSKSLFECPDDHAKKLQQLLMVVDRLLVVGWRAQEESFLQLMSARGWSDVPGLVVSADRASAEPTVDALRVGLPESHLVASDSNGFSGLVVDEDLIRRVWNGDV